MELVSTSPDNAWMPKAPKGKPITRPKFDPHFIKEWRKYRHMTQERLAAAADMSVANLSQLETGTQGYSTEGLQKLAKALRCEPGHLLSVNPLDDSDIWSIWEGADESQRKQIIAVTKAIIGR